MNNNKRNNGTFSLEALSKYSNSDRIRKNNLCIKNKGSVGKVFQKHDVETDPKKPNYLPSI